MARTRIKICGLTRVQDVNMVVAAGADAIGMVFYPSSQRFIALEQAASLRAVVPAFVCTTALFVNPDPGFVRQVILQVQPDLLQFHGDESAEFCESFGVRYLKAFRVGAPGLESAVRLAEYCQAYKQAAGWLFDSYSSGYGGSGQGFDLTLLQQVWQTPQAPVRILSGGLTPDTAGSSIMDWAPFAVDVSSGVESAPGLKDAVRVRAFIKAVQTADAQHRSR